MLMVTGGIMAAGLLASQLHAQNFEVSQNGKPVGQAFLSLKPAGGNVNFMSGAKIDMPGLKYNFSENAALDGGYHLTKVDLDGAVNGTSAKVGTTSNSQQYLMKINANGQVTNTPLAFHPQAVFLPDFDPGGLQVLLDLGAAHGNRDIWAVIPKQTGSIVAVRIGTQADMAGTLDGKPVTVHHLSVSYEGGKAEVFSGPQNELLQTEWTDEGFALVRKGFKLTPPAKAGAPPAAPQQPAQPGQAQQPQGQAPPQQQPPQ